MSSKFHFWRWFGLKQNEYFYVQMMFLRVASFSRPIVVQTGWPVFFENQVYSFVSILLCNLGKFEAGKWVA